MKRAIFLLVAIFSLTAISSFAADQGVQRGGVGVGNGRSVYRTDQGFSVVYASALTLAVHTASSFDISNEKLVAAEEKVSRISFTVSRNKAKTLAELKAMLESSFPGKSFVEGKFPGARGFFHESRDHGSLHGQYFLLTSNLDLVEVTIEAYPGGNGLAWIAPIVHTFAYDVTSPIIHELQSVGVVWESGSRQSIRVRVTDDNSGISLRNPFPAFRRVGEDGSETDGLFYSLNNMVAEGGDWYRVEINVPDFLPSGDYALTWLTVFDNAINTNGVWTQKPGDSHYRDSTIPVVRVRIVNRGKVDITQPEIIAIRPVKKEWIAGSWNRVHLQLRDDVSGIDLEKLNCEGLVLSNFPNGSYERQACRNPRHEGGDWYSVEVMTGKFLPSGNYFVHGFEMADRAGNVTRLSPTDPFDGNYESRRKTLGRPEWVKYKWGPALRVKVRNAGRADTTAPSVQEIRLDSHVWKAGSTQRFYFRATDDLSGIDTNGGKLHGYFSLEQGIEDARSVYVDREIVSMGNDWYYIEIKVSAHIRGGDYYLMNFSISDQLRNRSRISCYKKGTPLPADYCENSNGPNLPILRVRIER